MCTQKFYKLDNIQVSFINFYTTETKKGVSSYKNYLKLFPCLKKIISTVIKQTSSFLLSFAKNMVTEKMVVFGIIINQ